MSYSSYLILINVLSFADMAYDSKSAGSTPKPNYNKHFPRSFLLNYGEALQDLPEDKVLARLKSWNCEWLSRPNIGMSEMAATLKDNWWHIARYRGTVFTPSFVDQLENFCQPITPALRRLDNKDRNCNEPPDKDDILDVIEAIHKDEQTEALFTDAFNACGPLLMMSIHIITFNTLLLNPDAFAEQSIKNPATDTLRTNPSKQQVNQYLIDAILQKRRAVPRSADNLWDRSLYNAGTDTTPKHSQQSRRRRIDNGDDEQSTPGTSGYCATPRRRITTDPELANSSRSSETNRPSRSRIRQKSKLPYSTPVLEEDEDEEQTQSYLPRSSEKESRRTARRRAASKLPTSFDDDQEEHPQQQRKNKRPLGGASTAKNRKSQDRDSTTSDSEEELEPAPKKPKSVVRKQQAKPPKKTPTVPSTDSDLDDDELGITPRTPPKSPFYRGHRETTKQPNKTTTPTTSTATGNSTNGKQKGKKEPAKEKTTPTTMDEQKKKKKKKHTAELKDLARDQDQLYKDIQEKTSRSK